MHPRAVRVQVLPHRAANEYGDYDVENCTGMRIKMDPRLRDPAYLMPSAADKSSCNLVPRFLTSNASAFHNREIFVSRSTLQGNHSGCFLGVVDIKTKVAYKEHVLGHLIVN